MKHSLIYLLVAFFSCNVLHAADPVITELAKVDEYYAYIGEYVGKTSEGDVGVRLTTQGGSEPLFARIYRGGLPGLGWRTEKPELVSGSLDSQGVTLRSKDAGGRQVRSSAGKMLLVEANGQEIELKKINRRSVTQGKAAPANAKVLFDGKDTSAWKDAKVTDEGFLRMGTETVEPFLGGHLHVEFRTPYMPKSSGQKRGNSGVYLQRRYEVQVLDSFALEGIENECGAIYLQRRPDLNMALPPLVWQTYDIFLVPAQFDDKGEKTKSAELTVIHNGVPVHYHTLIKAKTGAGKPEGREPLPLLLQDHGDPVVFRNIWHVPIQSVPQATATTSKLQAALPTSNASLVSIAPAK